LDIAMFDIPFVSPASCGTKQTSIIPRNYALFGTARFVRVFCAIRVENAILVLTMDSTDFTDKVADKASRHRCCAVQTGAVQLTRRVMRLIPSQP
jgi:hypothetical protein